MSLYLTDCGFESHRGHSDLRIIVIQETRNARLAQWESNRPVSGGRRFDTGIGLVDGVNVMRPVVPGERDRDRRQHGG